MTVKAQRTQCDGKGDDYSALTALDFSLPENKQTLTRQEFKEECDINNILRRYGVDTPIALNGAYQTTDYSIDLQQALSAVEAARGVLDHVPEELKSKYRTPYDVLAAAENGDYQRDLDALKAAKAADQRAAARQKQVDEEIEALKRRETAERQLKRQREDASGAPEQTPKQ